jgi:hypothetical protein
MIWVPRSEELIRCLINIEFTDEIDAEEHRILGKFNVDISLLPDIERLAKEAMREADRIQGEVFDRLLSREPSPVATK